MRATGLTLGKTMAMFASASLVLATTPAFAADSSSSPAAPEVTQEKAEGKDPKKEEAQPAADATPPASGKVLLHLDAPTQVTLEKRAGAQSPWEHVCNSPCDEEVSVSDEFHIVGVDLRDSKPFMLDGKESKLTLVVQPGKRKDYETGLWILGGGGVLAVTGIVFIAAGSSSSSTFTDDGITHNKNTNWITAGTALILGGIVAGIYGGAKVLDNQHTTVNGPKATPEKKEDPGAGATVKLSAKREPTFREEKMAPTTAMTIPLLSGRF